MPNSATCPKCCRVVSLPLGGKPAAWVRCPLCRSEFLLQEAIDFVPPTLEIIPEPQQISGGASPDYTGIGQGNKSSSTVAKAARSTADQSIPELLINPQRESFFPPSSAFAPPTGSPPSSSDNDMVEELKLSPELPGMRSIPSTTRAAAGGTATDEPWNSLPAGANQAARMAPGANRLTGVRRKRRNPLVEQIKMIVGGVVGLTIGYGILLWGFKIDPFNLAKYLPSAILPEQLKPSDASGTSEIAHGDGAWIARNRPPDPFIQPTPLPSEAAPLRNAPPSAVTVLAPPKVETTATSAGAAAQDRAELPTLPEPSESPLEPQVEQDGPKTDVMFSLADVSQALTDAQQAVTAVDATHARQAENGQVSDVAKVKNLWEGHYASLAKLAETVTLLRDQNDDRQIARSTVAAFIVHAAGSRSRLDELSILFGAWWTSANRTDSGAVLAGTVEKVVSVGKQFRTTVKLVDRNAVVPVISSERPELSPDDKVLVLGVIVKDPAENLRGYTGEDPQVVWSAVIVKAAVDSVGAPS